MSKTAAFGAASPAAGAVFGTATDPSLAVGTLFARLAVAIVGCDRDSSRILRLWTGDTEQPLQQHALNTHALNLDLNHRGLLLENVPQQRRNIGLPDVRHAPMADYHSSGCCPSIATMSALMCDAFPPSTVMNVERIVHSTKQPASACSISF